MGEADRDEAKKEVLTKLIEAKLEVEADLPPTALAASIE